jgi:hypothetical protein
MSSSFTDNLTSNAFFYITLTTLICGGFQLSIKYAYKSRCKEIECCCVRIIRDSNAENKEDLQIINHTVQEV